jgi:2-methylcitrate dehydratase PrpD
MRTVTVDNAKGHPDNPVSDAELKAKFAHHVRLAGVPDSGVEALVDRVWTADEAPDASALLPDTVAVRNAGV